MKAIKLDISDAYRSIDDLPLHNFMRYRETSDANWFVMGFDGRQQKIDFAILEATEKEIVRQYEERADDKSFTNRINALKKINSLATKYETVMYIIDRFMKGFGSDYAQQEIRARYVKQMCAWGFHMEIMATVLEDGNRLAEIYDAVQGIKTQIAIEKEKMNLDEGKAVKSMNRDILIVSKALDMGTVLNPREISLGMWCECVKEVENLAQKN